MGLRFVLVLMICLCDFMFDTEQITFFHRVVLNVDWARQQLTTVRFELLVLSHFVAYSLLMLSLFVYPNLELIEKEKSLITMPKTERSKTTNKHGVVKYYSILISCTSKKTTQLTLCSANQIFQACFTLLPILKIYSNKSILKISTV